jgi:hypothetical protein
MSGVRVRVRTAAASRVIAVPVGIRRSVVVVLVVLVVVLVVVSAVVLVAVLVAAAIPVIWVGLVAVPRTAEDDHAQDLLSDVDGFMSGNAPELVLEGILELVLGVSRPGQKTDGCNGYADPQHRSSKPLLARGVSTCHGWSYLPQVRTGSPPVDI